MIPKPLAIRNASELPPLTWSELLYGFLQGYIGWKTVVDYASKKTDEGDLEADVIELAFVGKEDAWKVGDLLARLAVQKAESSHRNSAIWLFIFLQWLFDNKDEFQDPLMEIEEVYADFNYPEEMREFVRYMPPNDGYRPDLHTAEENKQRLYAKWKQYLDEWQRRSISGGSAGL